jgi:hypothetical protein
VEADPVEVAIVPRQDCFWGGASDVSDSGEPDDSAWLTESTTGMGGNRRIRAPDPWQARPDSEVTQDYLEARQSLDGTIGCWHGKAPRRFISDDSTVLSLDDPSLDHSFGSAFGSSFGSAHCFLVGDSGWAPREAAFFRLVGREGRFSVRRLEAAHPRPACRRGQGHSSRHSAVRRLPNLSVMFAHGRARHYVPPRGGLGSWAQGWAAGERLRPPE